MILAERCLLCMSHAELESLLIGVAPNATRLTSKLAWISSHGLPGGEGKVGTRLFLALYRRPLGR
jgi:hypothetical protein